MFYQKDCVKNIASDPFRLVKIGLSCYCSGFRRAGLIERGNGYGHARCTHCDAMFGEAAAGTKAGPEKR